MTNAEKLAQLNHKLLDANTELKRQAQWVGERIGAMAATKIAERKVARIQFQIEKLNFAEHLLGNCDAAVCSDCQVNTIAPDKWPARGSKLDVELSAR
jgi:hypothetical protein